LHKCINVDNILSFTTEGYSTKRILDVNIK